MKLNEFLNEKIRGQTVFEDDVIKIIHSFKHWHLEGDPHDYISERYYLIRKDTGKHFASIDPETLENKFGGDFRKLIAKRLKGLAMDYGKLMDKIQRIPDAENQQYYERMVPGWQATFEFARDNVDRYLDESEASDEEARHLFGAENKIIYEDDVIVIHKESWGRDRVVMYRKGDFRRLASMSLDIFETKYRGDARAFIVNVLKRIRREKTNNVRRMNMWLESHMRYHGDLAPRIHAQRMAQIEAEQKMLDFAQENLERY